jgi:hypothetical protein
MEYRGCIRFPPDRRAHPGAGDLEDNTRRTIDFREGEKIDEKALKTLMRAAVALNKAKAKS